MAIRELIIDSPTGYSVAGSTNTVFELAQSFDRQSANINRKLSILADWVEHRYVKKTAAYTVVDETVILADATGGAFSITLPPSNNETINRDLHVKRLNAGANAVTVAASGADTIDGAATKALAAQYASLHLLSDGAGAWHLL